MNIIMINIRGEYVVSCPCQAPNKKFKEDLYAEIHKNNLLR